MESYKVELVFTRLEWDQYLLSGNCKFNNIKNNSNGWVLIVDAIRSQIASHVLLRSLHFILRADFEGLEKYYVRRKNG